MRTTITEAGPTVDAVTPATGQGRILVHVITPGWGASGFYSEAAVKQAGVDKIWPAGTHMYLDHPTKTEAWERPVRTVKDLAAVTTSDAVWDPTAGALVAEARVFSAWKRNIDEMHDVIGVSIRAAADVENGEAEGKRGIIINRLVEGESIDFVTHAGRGGKIVQILESAAGSAVAEAGNVGIWLEARIHTEFTEIADQMFGDGRLTRDERAALTNAIGDALTAFVTTVDRDAPSLYQREVWDDPEPAGIPAQESTPIPPTPMEEVMPQIEEARLRELEEASAQLATITGERDAARALLSAHEARAKLRPAVTGVIGARESLPPLTRERLIGMVTEALTVDTTTEAATAAAEAACVAAEAEFTQALASMPTGRPRGLGTVTSLQSKTTPAPGLSEEAFADRLGLPKIGA